MSAKAGRKIERFGSFMKGVLICGELKEREITAVSKELITTGKRLSRDLDLPLSFLLVGENLQNIAEQVIDHGVGKVLTVEGPEFSELHPERLVAIITYVCKQTSPMIVLFGQTDVGRDVAPRLAAKLAASICIHHVLVD